MKLTNEKMTNAVRLIPKAKKREIRQKLADFFSDLIAETDHPVVLDKHGTLRWKESTAVQWVQEHAMRRCFELKIGDGDLNAFGMAVGEKITKKDAKQFYREMGYSLSGFAEIWHS